MMKNKEKEAYDLLINDDKANRSIQKFFNEFTVRFHDHWLESTNDDLAADFDLFANDKMLAATLRVAAKRGIRGSTLLVDSSDLDIERVGVALAKTILTINFQNRFGNFDLSFLIKRIEDAYVSPEKAARILPEHITVSITVNRANGSVILAPIDPHIRELIAKSNKRDNAYTAFIPHREVKQFMIDNSDCRFMIDIDHRGFYYHTIKIGRRWYALNEGGVLKMDSWTYRHMVGGQSD